LTESVRIWTASGTLVTAIAIVIEIICVYYQTDPETSYAGVVDVLIVLLITGAVLFAGAYWIWKQKINSILALILIVIGLIGISVSLSLHNMLVDLFFPRTWISAFLACDFEAVAMVGVFLLIFRRMPAKQDLPIESLEEDEQEN
jgi:multisubunit Na+/H+ antiporter MnhB subunit